MKRLMASLSISALAWGGSYDPFLLNTQLSLLPKIAMLEKNFSSTQPKSAIKILIAYDNGDEQTAELCTTILRSKFNDRLNGHPLIITILPFDKLNASLTSYQIIYALKANMSQLKKVHSAATSSTITALYDADKLGDDGLLLSIQMERTPVIMINAKALKENRFSFPDSLFEIARIVQ